jgi:hypothetical protein
MRLAVESSKPTTEYGKTKENTLWVIREKRTKAGGKIRRRPNSRPRRRGNRSERRRSNDHCSTLKAELNVNGNPLSH